MNFIVVWATLAKEQLTRLLADPELQMDVIRAFYRVEAILGYFPDQVGESRGTNKRIVIETPLTVYYRIDRANKLVRILRVLVPNQEP